MSSQPTATAAPSAMLRRAAPIEPCAEARDPSLVITGTLAEDAYSATEPATGRASFTVRLAQSHDRPEIIATRWVGDGHEARMHAHDRATALRAGDTVTVHGDGLVMRYRHGAMTLQVVLVRDVELEKSATRSDERTIP